MSLSEQECVRYGAVLHDIGKIGIPEAILNKPAKLTEEEYEVMKAHPKIGAQILARVKSLAPVLPLVLHDHECYDGSGYPDGLSGDAIPLGSRIISAVDAYDAMTTDRIYRKSPSHEYALKELRDNAGSQFDPKVVEALIAILNERKSLSMQEEVQQEVSQVKGKKGEILVVEDDPTFQKFLREALDSEGYEADPVESGEDAIHELEKRPYDLVIVDLNLAGWMSGLDLLREMHRLCPETKVIVCSAHEDDIAIETALKLGAKEFLRKPIEDLDRLFLVIG